MAKEFTKAQMELLTMENGKGIYSMEKGLKFGKVFFLAFII